MCGNPEIIYQHAFFCHGKRGIASAGLPSASVSVSFR